MRASSTAAAARPAWLLSACRAAGETGSQGSVGCHRNGFTWLPWWTVPLSAPPRDVFKVHQHPLTQLMGPLGSVLSQEARGGHGQNGT